MQVADCEFKSCKTLAGSELQFANCRFEDTIFSILDEDDGEQIVVLKATIMQAARASTHAFDFERGRGRRLCHKGLMV